MKEILSELGLQGVSHRSAVSLFHIQILSFSSFSVPSRSASVSLFFLLLTADSFTPTKVPNVRYDLSEPAPSNQPRSAAASVQVEHTPVCVSASHTAADNPMFPAAGVRPQRLQRGARSGHENDPDRLQPAGPGVSETGSVRVDVCLVLCSFLFRSSHSCIGCSSGRSLSC